MSDYKQKIETDVEPKQIKKITEAELRDALNKAINHTTEKSSINLRGGIKDTGNILGIITGLGRYSREYLLAISIYARKSMW